MSPLSLPHRITLRRCLTVAGGLALIGLFLWYVLFQARFLLAGPQVSFTTLPDTVQHERVITIDGTALNIVSLSLNGREIYTDKTGYFNEAFVLENGYTVATITARDRYGRERSYEHHFVYTGETTSKSTL